MHMMATDEQQLSNVAWKFGSKPNNLKQMQEGTENWGVSNRAAVQYKAHLNKSTFWIP